jgi:hypothetical protein
MKHVNIGYSLSRYFPSEQQNTRNSRDRLLEEQNAAYLDSVRIDKEKVLLCYCRMAFVLFVVASIQAEQRQREENERRKFEEDERQHQEEEQRKRRVNYSKS